MKTAAPNADSNNNEKPNTEQKQTIEILYLDDLKSFIVRTYNQMISFHLIDVYDIKLYMCVEKKNRREKHQRIKTKKSNVKPNK